MYKLTIVIKIKIDTMNIENKINIVKNILKDKKVAIGFSGGADSTLIAYLSSKVAKDTLAITIDNHLFPNDFTQNTAKTANLFKIKHEIIDIDFYKDKTFLLNDSRRCYNCRTLMYDIIEKTAQKNAFDFICDGNNISDLVQDRPGILVTYKKSFKTPLIDAKLTSKEIHEYLKKHNIPYSKSTTCLATRIPTDTEIKKEKIDKIRHCEDFILNNTNCEIVKVRDFESNGIVEVDNIYEILRDDKYKQINDELKQYNFKKVSLNLSPIKDNDHITIDCESDSFSYKLPYTINIENTKKQIKDKLINVNKEKIELENIEIYQNGLIKGFNLKNYETALDTFMDILSKLRRNI